MDSKTMAIAITLIVALPIGLGYVLAFEDVETVRYDEVRTVNITDQLVNGTAPQFALRDLAEVNSWRFARQVIQDSSGQLVPAELPATFVYDHIGATHTSIPYKEVMASSLTASGTKSIPLAQYWTYTLTNGTTTTIAPYGNLAWLQQSGTDSIGPIGTLTYINSDRDTIVIGNIRSATCTQSAAAFYIDYSSDVVGSYADWTGGWHTTAAYLPLSGDVQIYSLTRGATVRFGDIEVDVAIRWQSQSYQTIVTVGAAAPTVVYSAPTSYDVLFSFGVDRAGNLTVAFHGAHTALPAVGVELPALWATTVSGASSNAIITGSSSLYRIDRATIEVADYPIMTGVEFSAARYFPGADGYEFITSKVSQLGSSITFAGATYPVDPAGYITVGGKRIALNDCVFRSVSGTDGQYRNSIAGLQVADTAALSTVQLAGSWAMITQVRELDAITTTTTEWQPGVFVYNAFDSDFAIAGLLGCVGVFVALGIIGRRSGAKVGALLLICGGGALFFLMLI